MSKDGLVRARHSQVERRLWNDLRFRSLTPIQPCGAGLWLYLLTTPELGSLPGLIVMGESAMAEHLRWPIKAFREAFAEVSARGMAEADWEARLVITIKSISRSKPESPNVIRSWRQQWFDVPECELKSKYYRELSRFIEAFHKGYSVAFSEAIGEPSAKPLAKATPNQEMEMEMEKEASDARAHAGTVSLNADQHRIAETIRSLPSLGAVDPVALAATVDGQRLGSGRQLDWILGAIRGAASELAGVEGLNRESVNRKVLSFTKRASAKDLDVAPAAEPTTADVWEAMDRKTTIAQLRSMGDHALADKLEAGR